MKRTPHWTLDELKIAIQNSHCYSEVMEKLGYKRKATQRTIRKYVEEHKLDISHFVRWSCLDGKKLVKYQLEEILIENSPYKTASKLKMRLIRDGILKEICISCGALDWMGKKLTLQLDHINGNSNDNRLENLRLLCPNCHSLTDTYAGKNIDWTDRKRPRSYCIRCNKEVVKNSISCQECRPVIQSERQTKREWPSNEDLLKMVKEFGALETSRKLNSRRTIILSRLKRAGYEVDEFLAS